MAKKKLTISLLVSGREDTTEKCLDSLKPLMEQVDSELILVDTGCDEKLKQSLTKYTDRIVPFAWCDDFAKARNAGLELAVGEWFMYMDDDEWFEDVTPIIRFFQSGRCDEYDQAVYKVRNYNDYEGTSYTDEWVSRLIRVEEDTCFSGKVHEILGPARGECAMLEAYAHHYGYVNVDSEVLRGKVLRNVPLLLAMVEDEPNNLRWRIQIVQEYLSIQSYDEAICAAQEAIGYIAKIDKRFVNQCRHVFETAILRALHSKGDDAEVMTLAKCYLEDVRNTNQGNAAICFYGLKAAQKGGFVEEAIAFGERGLAVYDAWQQEELGRQEMIIEQSLLFVKDVTKEENHLDMLRQYVTLCIQSNRMDKILAQHRNQLQQLLERILDNNADFFNLPKDIQTMLDAKLMDMEAAWLSLELSQWAAAVQVLKQRGIMAFEQAKNLIAAYRTKEDIRYSFFRKEYAAVFMALESATEDYETLVGRFAQFTEGTLEYYAWIFREEAFLGKMEMLSGDARAAVWLNRMFSCGEDDWEGKIADLREAAKCYPPLGNNIKRLAAFMKEKAAPNQENDKNNLQKEKAREAREELLRMVEIMKDKIRLMAGQGMHREALAVLEQVRALAPEDTELAEMEDAVRGVLTEEIESE